MRGDTYLQNFSPELWRFSSIESIIVLAKFLVPLHRGEGIASRIEANGEANCYFLLIT